MSAFLRLIIFNQLVALALEKPHYKLSQLILKICNTYILTASLTNVLPDPDFLKDHSFKEKDLGHDSQIPL